MRERGVSQNHSRKVLNVHGTAAHRGRKAEMLVALEWMGAIGHTENRILGKMIV